MSGNAPFSLGVAKAVATPAKPLRLAGYANRTAAYESVREDIYVRVHYYAWGGRRLVFVYGDLLWWGSDFVAAAREALQNAHGLSVDEVFFFASHNHSGPGTSRNFLPVLETVDEAYLAALRATVVEAVGRARDDVEPVMLHRHDGWCDLNVYRRRMVDGTVAMLPNYREEADRRLTVLAHRRADGSVKALTVSYACHANVAGDNTLHPDYPGIALRLLDETHPGCVSLFLQGCAADLRPNCVVGRRFFAGSYDQAAVFATDFHDDCLAVLAAPGKKIVANPMVRRGRAVLLLDRAMEDDGVRRELVSEDEVQRQWAAAMLAKNNRAVETLDMAAIRFAPEWLLFVFSAEVVQVYAAYARELCPGAVAVSCADGMLGYIPVAAYLREGGYEADGSTRYFALAGRFRAETEELVRGAMRNLLLLQ